VSPAVRRAPLEALTSDAWYTLFFVAPSERRELARRRRSIWSAPLLRAGLGKPRVLRLLRRRARWTREEEARGRTPTVAEQLDRLGAWAGVRTEPDDLLPALDAALLRARVQLAPGALEAVRSLEGSGVPLAIVSNVLNESGRAARLVLERLGLLPHFRAVVLSCEHPWAKPAPEPFRLACRFLGTTPGRTVHVGDLAYDLRGARAAGLDAWWYAGLRRLNRYLPGQVDPRAVPSDETIRAWAELPPRFLDGPQSLAGPGSRVRRSEGSGTLSRDGAATSGRPRAGRGTARSRPAQGRARRGRG
jgi:FMN phosphatase YigB (HAD superfamily)